MDFDEMIKRLKDFLVNDKYNVLGYSYSEKQSKNVLPWILNKKKKEPLPPMVGEWLAKLQEKYSIAAQMKKKLMGQWAGPYYFFAIKADVMSEEDIKSKLKEFEGDVLERRKFYGKGSKLYELDGRAIPVNLLAFIFEDGVSDDLYSAVRNCYKDLDVTKLTRPYVIDLQGKRCDRGEGKGGWFVGTPNPKDMVKIFFS